jgi:hypothetical protein
VPTRSENGHRRVAGRTEAAHPQRERRDQRLFGRVPVEQVRPWLSIIRNCFAGANYRRKEYSFSNSCTREAKEHLSCIFKDS